MNARKKETILNEIIAALTEIETPNLTEQSKPHAKSCLQVTNFFRENRNKLVRGGIASISAIMIFIALREFMSQYAPDNDSSQANYTQDASIKNQVLGKGSGVAALTFAMFLALTMISKKCWPGNLPALPETDANQPQKSLILLKNVNTFTDNQMKAIIALCQNITEIVDRKATIKISNNGGSIVQNPVTSPFFSSIYLHPDEKINLLKNTISVPQCLNLLNTFMDLAETEPDLLNKPKLTTLLTAYANAAPKNDVSEKTPLQKVTVSNS